MRVSLTRHPILVGLLIPTLLLSLSSVFAGTNVLEVKCVDASGQPISKGKVYAWQVGQQKTVEKKLNKQGVAVFDKLEDGFFRVWSKPEGFAPVYQEFVEVKGGARQSVTLTSPPVADAKPLYFEDPEAVGKSNLLTQEGAAAAQAGNAELAESKFKEAISIFPGEPNTYYQLAYIYLGTGRFDQAEETFKKAVSLLNVYMASQDPASVAGMKRQYDDIQTMLGTIPLRKIAFEIDQAMQAKKWDDALVSLDKLAAIQPNNSNAYYNMAIALSQLNRLDEAEAKLDKALEIEPNQKAFKDLKSKIGEIKAGRKKAELKAKVFTIQQLVNEKKYDEALAKIPDALATTPEDLHPQLWALKAECHLSLEQYSEYFDASRKQLELAGKPVDQGLFEMGQDLVRRGKQAQARLAFEKVLEANPSYAEAYYQLGMDAFYEAGDKVKAKEMLEKYIAIGKDENNINNAKNVLIVMEKEKK